MEGPTCPTNKLRFIESRRKFRSGQSTDNYSCRNLITAANEHGLIIIGFRDNTIKGIDINILDFTQTKGQPEIVDLVQFSFIYQLTFSPTLLSVARDGYSSVLLIAGRNDSFPTIEAYDIATKSSIGKLELKELNNTDIIDYAWHPNYYDSVIVLCTSNGHLLGVGINKKDKGIVLLYKNAQYAALSCCWSPKGKNLAVGTVNGRVFRLEPVFGNNNSLTFKEVDKSVLTFTHPKMSPEHQVVKLIWVNKTFLLCVHARQNSPNGPGTIYSLITVRPSKPYLYWTNICFENQMTQNYIVYLANLSNSVVCCTSTSSEAAVIGVLGAKEASTNELNDWNSLIIDEEGARIELPLDSNNRETNARGLTIGFVKNSQPILIFYTSDGMICSYSAIHSENILKLPEFQPEQTFNVEVPKPFQTFSAEPAKPLQVFGAEPPKPLQVFGSDPPKPLQVFGSDPPKPPQTFSSVSKEQTLGGSATFGGLATFGGPATFGGLATFGSSATFGGPATIGGAATFGGSATSGSTTTPAGPATFGSSATFGASVTSSGTTTPASPATFANSATFGGPATIGGAATFGASATSGGTTTPAGPATFASSATFGASATSGGTTTPAGLATLGSSATIGGAATFGPSATSGGTTTPAGLATLGSSATFGGPATIGGAATPAGPATFGGLASFSTEPTYSQPDWAELENEVSKIKEKMEFNEVYLTGFDELNHIRDRLNEICEIHTAHQDVIEVVKQDVDSLDLGMLENYYLIEYIKSRQSKKKSLDPITLKKVDNIKTKVKGIAERLKELNDHVDLSWEDFLRYKSGRERKVNSVEMVYMALATNQKIINLLKKKIDVEPIKTPQKQYERQNHIVVPNRPEPDHTKFKEFLASRSVVPVRKPVRC